MERVGNPWFVHVGVGRVKSRRVCVYTPSHVCVHYNVPVALIVNLECMRFVCVVFRRVCARVYGCFVYVYYINSCLTV